MTRASAEQLRAAAICLINRARRRWDLPALHERWSLDRAAQRHTDDMVARGYFAHTGPGGRGLGARVSREGYNWRMLGEDLSTGFATPASAVRSWMSHADHCELMFAPYYRDIGIGVNRRPVRGAANVRGTWTADFGLRATAHQPSRNYTAAATCPH